MSDEVEAMPVQEAVEAVMVSNIGMVVSDINLMTFEDMNKMASSPEFNENAVLQEIVAKWKKVHIGNTQ